MTDLSRSLCLALIMERCAEGEDMDIDESEWLLLRYSNTFNAYNLLEDLQERGKLKRWQKTKM